MSQGNTNAFEIVMPFNCSAETVFEAWTDRDVFRQWLFVGVTGEVISVECDLVEGGRFSVTELEHVNHSYINYYGRYQLVEFPTRLIFTLLSSTYFGDESLVSVHIKPLPEGCELTLLQTGIDREQVEDSWKRMLAKLKSLIDH